MAVTISDCVAIAEAVRRAGVMLAVCHVLRYTPYQQKIQEILASVRLCMHAQCQPVCVSPLSLATSFACSCMHVTGCAQFDATTRVVVDILT